MVIINRFVVSCMNRKLGVLFFLAFAVLCLSVILKAIDNQSSRTIKYTITEYIENPTTSTKEIIKITTAASEKAKKSTKTKLTDVEKNTVTTVSPLFPIDINSADVETLCFLDGIGETLAQSIVDYRNENGDFLNIEEIMNVYGIGENIFNKICENIYVENPFYPEFEESEEIEDEQIIEEYPEESEENEMVEDVTEEIELTLDEAAPIEINTADSEILMLLPHVNEIIAEDIIELREKLGGFSSTYELLYIEELSDKQVSEIIDYVFIAENQENIS